MHTSARIKAELFIKHYQASFPGADGLIRVLEIGSKSYLEQDTLRPLFPDSRFSYTGLDIEPGKNVDFVPKDAYVWHELERESFEVVVSSQTFEHNPYFWVTFCEMSRVLTQSGWLFVTAPGSGKIHRFPLDCWSFYPDSWQALCSMAGMELVESHFESDRTAAFVPGGVWRDSSVIARKPSLAVADAERFYRRLDAISSPFRHEPFATGDRKEAVGPCFTDYEATVVKRHTPNALKKLERSLRRYSAQKITE